MKRFLLIAALALAALSLRAQEMRNDTIIDGIRYAIMTDGHGDVTAYRSASPFDERQAVLDLNERLRSIAVYQTVAVPTAIAGAFALSYAYQIDQNKNIPFKDRVHCERPGWAVFGVAASVTSVVFGILSYAELWTPRLYINQEGLVFRLDGKSTKWHPWEKDDEEDE